MPIGGHASWPIVAKHCRAVHYFYSLVTFTGNHGISRAKNHAEKKTLARAREPVVG
jgi:hypothetical protein